MMVWVLLIHLFVGGKPMPFLAFSNQQACNEAYNSLPDNHPPADCIPFAADPVLPPSK
jgi:hypothetical protein